MTVRARRVARELAISTPTAKLCSTPQARASPESWALNETVSFTRSEALEPRDTSPSLPDVGEVTT